jgi:hypothetical protein
VLRLYKAWYHVGKDASVAVFEETKFVHDSWPRPQSIVPVILPWLQKKASLSVLNDHHRASQPFLGYEVRGKAG